MQTEFRRKAPRRPYDGSVGVLFRGTMHFIPCLQVGEGGALLSRTPELSEIQQGDTLVLTIFFPKIGGVVATAECVYVSDEENIGLSFQQLSMDFKKKIREFVSRRKSVEAA